MAMETAAVMVMATTTTTTMAMATTPTLAMTTTMPHYLWPTTAITIIMPSDSWLINNHGKACAYLAGKVAKHRAIRPAVDNILQVGNTSMQAAVLHAVVNHPSLASACELPGIESLKRKAAANFLGQQSARMMEHN
jgi:hypothetical protein